MHRIQRTSSQALKEHSQRLHSLIGLLLGGNWGDCSDVGRDLKWEMQLCQPHHHTAKSQTLLTLEKEAITVARCSWTDAPAILTTAEVPGRVERRQNYFSVSLERPLPSQPIHHPFTLPSYLVFLNMSKMLHIFPRVCSHELFVLTVLP